MNNKKYFKNSFQIKYIKYFRAEFEKICEKKISGNSRIDGGNGNQVQENADLKIS
ncbi:MAG: hypothetical protein ACJAZC_000044 [Cryomorphaceae bacterium]|jgi:hypothetical protein